MSQDRRITIIRFWLLCIAAVVLAFMHPAFAATLAAGMAVAPLGMLMRCFCCGDCDSTCAGGVPLQVQVEWSGFDPAGFCLTGGGATCDNKYNTTDVLNRSDLPVTCPAEYSSSCTYVGGNAGCGGIGTKVVCLEIGDAGGGNIGVFVRITDGSPHWLFRNDDTGLNLGDDCTTISGVTISQTQAGALCDPVSPDPSGLVSAL